MDPDPVDMLSSSSSLDFVVVVVVVVVVVKFWLSYCVGVVISSFPSLASSMSLASQNSLLVEFVLSRIFAVVPIFF